MKLIIISILGLLLLGGCGSDSDTDTPSDTEQAFIDLLQGKWTTNCRDESNTGSNFLSSVSTFEFSETKIINTGIEYSDTNCTTQDDTWGPDESTVKIGNLVKDANGGDAYEFDYIEVSSTQYYLAKIVTNNQLHLASGEGGEGNDGSTAEKRSNEFLGGDDIWYKEE